MLNTHVNIKYIASNEQKFILVKYLKKRDESLKKGMIDSILNVEIREKY